MTKFGEFICKNKVLVLIVSVILLFLSFIGMKLTKINYDVLVYLPEDIETIQGQNTLTDDFHMGAYSVAIIENMNSKEIIELEKDIREVEGVNKVASIYDVIGTSFPIEMLPSEIKDKLHKKNTDLLLITFDDSTSAEQTINAVRDIRKIVNDDVRLGGMSSMVLDTMNLSEQEILIYIVIAVILCILVLELSLDSYLVPFLLLVNIGFGIMFNLGSNIFLGQISYITKALVAVLQLGVTTDFSIFLYHSYEDKKKKHKNKDKAMTEAIKDTFKAVTGSSLTTIAGFLVLCTMQLTLGRDLGIVMAKGVLLGVVTVLTLFPSLILVFDKYVDKTSHKVMLPKFEHLNKFIVKHNVIIAIIFVLMIIPAYRAYSNVDVYYKIDKTLPATLESIRTNEDLKNDFNIVSPEIILLDNEMKINDVDSLITDLRKVEGIDFVLSFNDLKKHGITEEMLPEDLVKMIKNDKYQVVLFNSIYEVASDELNEQITKIDKIVKKYDKNAITAGEGPLMKDLIRISDTDFKNVNFSSIACIFIILILVLKSISLPVLLISVIEFAIFTNMGISYLGGVTLPFVASIVLGTIQLGATIDYAILLTTTYLKNRNKYDDKKEAMIETLNYVTPSIIVSGMCFFGATFGVGVYSDLEMVGSLCTLISRGAIISMLAVILILPSILLIFDKIIFRKKESGVKMKKVAKLSLIIMLLASSNVSALTKTETVYTKLDNSGKVNNVIINEHLINSDKLDVLEDYSELKDILNLSSDEKIKKDGNNLSIKSNKKDVLYQGTIKKELPISVSVSYKLNGKEKKLKEMLGKKGSVEISIKYTNKDSHSVLVDNNYETLYTPFIITMATTLDSKVNSNINITNGKVITNGEKSVLVALALPGLYDSTNIDLFNDKDTITISFDTDKFELPSIYSVITPKLIDSEDLDIFNKMDTIYESANKLKDGIDKIEEGSKKLKEGSSEFKNVLASSIQSIDTTSNALTDEQVGSIASSTKEGALSKLTDEKLEEIGNTTWEKVEEELDPNDATIRGYISTAVGTYLMSVDDTGALALAYQTCAASANPDNEPACATVAPHNPVITAIINSIKNTSLYTAENVSKQVSKKVVYETTGDVSYKVASEVSPLVANSVKNNSIELMTSSLNTIYSNVEKLDNGIGELNDGIIKFNKEGISKIYEMSNELQSYSSRFKKLIELSNEYNTFAGNLEDVDSDTKFILVIDSEKVKEKKKETKKKEKEDSLLDRLGKLF